MAPVGYPGALYLTATLNCESPTFSGKTQVTLTGLVFFPVQPSRELLGHCYGLCKGVAWDGQPRSCIFDGHGAYATNLSGGSFSHTASDGTVPITFGTTTVTFNQAITGTRLYIQVYGIFSEYNGIWQ